MGISESWKGQLLCSLAMVLVGSTVVVSKVIAQDIEPFAATVLRHALALPVFLALMRWHGQRLPRVGRRDALLLTVQAAAGSVGYSVLLILGVSLASAADAGIVAGTLPAAAALFSALLLGERPGLRLVLSIALATAGVMAVALAPESAPPGGASTRLAGIALVLAAVACEAVFILANKRLSQPIAALALSTLMSAGGLLLSALSAWLVAQASPSTFTVPALAGVLYYAWVPTVGGFLLWYAGSARTSGVRASLATVWLPVAALLLSVVFLGESIRSWQWLGLGCVVAALLLASLPAAPGPGD
ncbi:DMT family transporter [Acidovorax sp. A1169]|uniref:DMT family transporter n=1 Tax=Acidovorax sp. A1169 TaxID=3059524 RepID=UPI002737C071|nr:DMT family transporter [Acidovorax sp. A1169]MDP4075777.1 DMT family transporter [Acidovorax sp. A1169]